MKNWTFLAAMIAATIVANSAFAGQKKLKDCGVIGDPGSYFLEGNLPGKLGLNPDGGCLVITADDVTLDLRGFGIVSDGSGSIGRGISLDGRSNVEIRSGTVRGFSGDGVSDQSTGENHRVSDLRVIGNGGVGIRLQGSDHQVANSIAGANGSAGILVGIGSLVTGCTANGNGIRGIEAGAGSAVSGNIANGNATEGILALNDTTVSGNTANDNGGNGILVGPGSIVSGNKANGNTANGIAVANPGGVAVTNNMARDNGSFGIVTTNSLVDANTAVDNGLANIAGCSDCTFGTNHAP